MNAADHGRIEQFGLQQGVDLVDIDDEPAPAREALADSVLRVVGRSNLRMTRRPARRLTRPLDPRSEHELVAVLKSLRPALAEGEIVRECIAGYQYHGGPDLESGLRVGRVLLSKQLDSGLISLQPQHLGMQLFQRLPQFLRDTRLMLRPRPSWRIRQQARAVRDDPFGPTCSR